MKKFLYLSLFAILIFLVLFIFLSRPDKSSIRIGLMTTLTGKSPELGREIRDGAFLAVEEINKWGGIKGKNLSLIIKDNKGSPEIAKQNFLELVRENVVAIIGPSTSTVAKAVIPLANENKILLISPTVSASEFTGKDDYFVTLHPNTIKLASVFGKFIMEKSEINRISIILDEKNPVYTRDFISNFNMNLAKIPSIKEFPFNEEKTDFDKLVENAVSIKPDFILLVTDSYNAAILTHKIRKIRPALKIGLSHWARFHGFLEHTGQLSNGVLSLGFYDQTNQGEDYIKFEKKFKEIFGYIPDSPAINAYQAVFIIYEALLKKTKKDKIKDFIINKGIFKGIFGEFSIDRYGDVLTEPFVVRANNGVFERVLR